MHEDGSCKREVPPKFEIAATVLTSFICLRSKMSWHFLFFWVFWSSRVFLVGALLSGRGFSNSVMESPRVPAICKPRLIPHINSCFSSFGMNSSSMGGEL